MSPFSLFRDPSTEGMRDICAGEIVLRDEGTRTNWKVEVGAFRLAPYPVTHELYRAVRGEPPVGSAGPRTPVTEVSWKDAVQFCNLLSQATGLEPCYSVGHDADGQDVVCDWAADGYRLPSEAEWEYACRAGTSGDRYGELDEIAWHRGNSGGAVHDVATRAPNAWGLHDMIGNVWEWCWDVYDPAVYGPYRVFRGGGGYDHPRGCRASCRRKSHPTFRIDDLGFRLARSR
ncbi:MULTISPECIES: formylglycine-generating enzyme family protein [unclassified Streptomyces]|uniref:formylglycine-generating enzyme family protein n=1 Tax=unclassified Streptomyces TaxID=2593676 RepID=UPI00224F3580|nr:MULTISPECIES: SUMF1/EgtB/PvdO family nonheme iron enzyme [unclassified Streptomyces]WSP59210.1 formylglycine-generating enzyme family protein [Streptomyces sp. NBC_01241]WSU20268.1 formylglycine-generating enzyme family protein [Streptomyces sp. NBC_01108]MCX4790961.1 formylglycine-generating enzyme family protein [Streptomyces sp. NBC_01221]MCX4793314.1 formylglycine-generating enzyme family protein [Streptomyces sp. NBC_01242]WSJ34754.1 formylglycine-generating enzyme family protein [Stre